MVEATASNIINTILNDPTSPNFCILGGPKSGKTQTLISLAACLIEKRCKKPVILTARDEDLPQLRERCAQSLPIGAFSHQSISSFSYFIINTWCRENKRPMPGVLTGFDQDAILQDIIASQESLISQAPSWFNPSSLKFRSFRNELRLLIAKALQYGWTGQNLVDTSRKYLATSNGSSYLFLQLWPVCAQVIDQYFRICKYDPNSTDTLFYNTKVCVDPPAKDADLKATKELSIAQSFHLSGQLMDINMQQILASNILRKEYKESNYNSKNKQLILVDSAQNLSPLAQQFLQSLALSRAQIVIFLDPDSAINTHQGADARLIINFPNSKAIILNQYKYANPHIQNVVSRVSSSIGVNKYYEHRVPQIKVLDANTSAIPAYAKVYSDRLEQYREVANLILFLNKVKAVPFTKIVLALRSRENFETIEEVLSDAEIPIVRDKVMAAKDTSVAAICAMAQMITTGDVDSNQILNILCSPIFSCRRVEIANYLSIIKEEIALEIAGSGTDWADFRKEWAHLNFLAPLWEFKQRIKHALEILHTPDYKTYAVLLALWKGRGATSADELIKQERADLVRQRSAQRFGFLYYAHLARRLDSLYAFFNFAQKFTHTHSLQNIDLFLQIWNAQKHESFPSEPGQNTGVTLTTPSGIADRCFDALILPDMNEYTWPNIKIRDRLLGAGFIDFTSSTDSEELITYAEFIKISRDNLRNQELQMLLASVAAPCKYLFATAVENDRNSASQFLKFFTQTDVPLASAVTSTPLSTSVSVPHLSARFFKDYLLSQIMTEQNLSKQVSSILNGHLPHKNTREIDALFALSYMNKGKRLQGKIPFMRDRTSKNCLIDLSSLQFRSYPKLSLSPSSLSSFLICPVCWFYSQYACAGVSSAQKFGIALHLLAQNVQYHTSLNDFFKYVKEVISNIKLPKWEEVAFDKRITFAAENLWEFFNKGSLTTVGSEIPFSFTLNTPNPLSVTPDTPGKSSCDIHLAIKGRIDKLCIDKESKHLYVLDIKSGKKTSKVYKFENIDLPAPQLAAYAMAIKLAKNKELTDILRAAGQQSTAGQQSAAEPPSAKLGFVFPESEQRDIVKTHTGNIDFEEFQKVLAEIAILQSGNISSSSVGFDTGFPIYSHQHAYSGSAPACVVLTRREITDL